MELMRDVSLGRLVVDKVILLVVVLCGVVRHRYPLIVIRGHGA